MDVERREVESCGVKYSDDYRKQEWMHYRMTVCTHASFILYLSCSLNLSPPKLHVSLHAAQCMVLGTPRL